MTVLMADIKAATAGFFPSLNMGDFTNTRRQRRITRPRQIAMALSRHMTPRSFPEIGKHFGGRHHTTALHAFRKVSGLIAEDPRLGQTLDEIASGARGRAAWRTFRVTLASLDSLCAGLSCLQEGV